MKHPPVDRFYKGSGWTMMNLKMLDGLNNTPTLLDSITLPMVEIFQTVEGEGTRAGYPTTFVRVFNCNLRCTWCDTKYSYAPAKPEYFSTLREIVDAVKKFKNHYVCLTGGEPLMHGNKSLHLVQALAQIDCVQDVHIETNGAIDLQPFVELRKTDPLVQAKVRFVMDYKLQGSGEQSHMMHTNFALLQDNDEIKFVIANLEDFQEAQFVYQNYCQKGVVLFSPVWDSMPPERLVKLILEQDLKHIKLNLQIHKVIWDPQTRGV